MTIPNWLNKRRSEEYKQLILDDQFIHWSSSTGHFFVKEGTPHLFGARLKEVWRSRGDGDDRIRLMFTDGTQLDVSYKVVKVGDTKKWDAIMAAARS